MENATPINFEITMKRNVREQKIREQGVNHENHENIMPRKFGAIRYLSDCIRNNLEGPKYLLRGIPSDPPRQHFI